MDTHERNEVRRWVQDAITLYKKAGKETLLKELADPGGRFVLNESYIFALNIDGTMVAHPTEPQLTGKNLMDLRDSEGNAFIRKIIDTAKNTGYGYLDYKWRRPESDDEVQKTVFFELVDDIILCSGLYIYKESFLDSITNYYRFYGWH